MDETAQTPKTEKKRFVEFDIIRAVSLMVMVMIHIREQMSGLITESAMAATTWINLGYATIGPSAFMMCMGINLSFSKRHTPRNLAIRGLRFLELDVMLNFLRFGIPALVLAMLGDSEIISYWISNTLRSDIYAFVGVFSLVFALFKKMKLSPAAMLNVSVLMMIVNMLISLLGLNSMDNELVSGFLGRFVWMDHNSYFSLFGWTFFPVIGYCFGPYYKNMTEEKRSKFLWSTLTFGSLFLLALLLSLKYEGVSPDIILFNWYEYYMDIIRGVMLVLSGACSLSCVGLLAAKTKGFVGWKFAQWLSGNITTFYMIHWTIIGWVQFTLYAMGSPVIFKSDLHVYLVTAVILSISLFLTFSLEKIKMNRKNIG